MSDPRKLLDDDNLSTATRAVLEQYQGIVPPEGAQEAVAAKLAMAIAQSGAAANGGAGIKLATAATKGGLGVLPKVLLVSILAGGGGLTFLALRARSNPPADVAVSAPSGTLDEDLPSAPAPAVQNATVDSVTETPDTVESETRPTAPARQRPRKSQLTSRIPATKTGPAVPPAPVVVPPPASMHATQLAAEARGIEEAQHALTAKKPALALSLADKAASTFGDGQLRQEREAIRIEALLQMGKKDEARKLTVGFRKNYPSSPHLARIEQLLSSEVQ